MKTPLILFLLPWACRNEIKTPVVTTEETEVVLLDSDGDGFFEDEDCDDSDSSIYPNAPEICDGVDNNCNAEVDEGVTLDLYVDADGDGFGNIDLPTVACAVSDGMVPNANDCDDADPTVFPSAPEICDDIDNDCDGTIDEDILGTWYRDADGDGFGTIEDVIQGCFEEGYLDVAGDCDDSNPEVSPLAEESCDEVDNDCDGEVDEGLLISVFVDADEDGYGDDANIIEVCSVEAGMATIGGDCDDINALISPDATETCDGLDNDCDGDVDGSNAVGALTWYRDADTDGFGDPNDFVLHCDPQTGYITDNTDCAPMNNSQYPGAPEYCNGADDNCDGVVDEQGAIGSSTYYPDNDGDGFGANANSVLACQQPTGTVNNNLDCVDSDATIYLGAAEICDGQVNSCGNLLSSVESDDDGDGYVECLIDLNGWDGDASVVGGLDCDDAEQTVFPGAPELCDGLANTCDNIVPTDEIDDDGDGYVECTVTTPWSGVVGGDDCDDGNPVVSPSTAELCDGIVNVCGNALPANEIDDDGDGYVECNIHMTGWVGDSSVVDGGDCDDSNPNTAPNIAYLEGNSSACMTDADGDGFGAIDASVGFQGTDCDDNNAGLNPDLGSCAEGLSCKDILDNGASQGSGVYLIDPDGPLQGVDAFEVYCDMTPGDAGWTEVPYAASLQFQRQFTGGDAPAGSGYWLPNDFQLELSDPEIQALRAVSTEGKQDYVGLCNGVIHHYYISGNSYAYAFAFELFDGTILGGGISMGGVQQVTVLQDGCSTNGGEGGAINSSTIFTFDTPSVPVVNVRCRDCGDSSEFFGSPLTTNSAWLR